MTQSKWGSLIETCTHTAIGFVIAYFLGHWLYVLYDIPVSHSANFQITCWFTVVSIARGYVVRRWFNARIHKAIQQLAGTQ